MGFDNVLEAKDMKMKVDGVEYTNSSNSMTISGLKISATKIGESTINIEEDNSQLTKQMETFAKAYNELNATIDKELYSADSSISDKAALRDVMSKVKSTLFGTGNADATIFSYGFSFNEKNGDLKFEKYGQTLTFNSGEKKEIYLVNTNSLYYFYVVKGQKTVEISPISTIQSITKNK